MCLFFNAKAQRYFEQFRISKAQRLTSSNCNDFLTTKGKKDLSLFFFNAKTQRFFERFFVLKVRKDA